MHLWSYVYSVQTIKNYITGELKIYVRINTEELNFLKIKNSFFLRMRYHGFSKNRLSHWFSEVKYSNRAKFLAKKPINTCHFQGMRETEAERLLIKISEDIISEEIISETIIDNSEGAAEVVSEEEGDMISMVALDNLDGLLFKGRSKAMFPSLLSTTNVNTNPANLTVLSPQTDNEDEKLCCIFPGSTLEIKTKIDTIFKEETAKLFESSFIKKAFKNTKICAVVKNKKSSKNLVVKTKI